MSHNQPLFDVTIIGGGPAGLFAAFYAGLRGMRTKIIESLDHLGGQLTTLYPEKFIYDVAGYPAVLAKTLAAELIRQAAQYQPDIVLNEQVHRLRRLDPQTIELETQQGRHYSRTVVITAGGGAFTPKRLPGREYSHYEGRGLHYFITDLLQFRGKQIVVIGGGDSAVDWALNLKRVTGRITIVHRRDKFRAHEDSVAKLYASGVDIRTFHELKALHGETRVEAVTIFDNRTGAEETLPADAVLVNIGFVSTLGPIHEWGLALDENGIVVNSKMETNLPGIFAAGDVVSYPGKLKLIATGFGEAAIAVNHAKVFIDPESDSFPGHSSTTVPRQRKAGRAAMDEAESP
ncbi:MAG TPA: NAD(P)/FAD-dependent oxidoreductase [Phycisphaerae bacterium]|jgi:thioredoxin reductase (NADPH)|nr:NAD(P)/FAD-dependent oxidoreductase [Phycisphaerae bacterium]HOB75932.1 NAD(P)/FAD-dependent oxidoreductase [Phycisphaerae bacterium]HOJ55538.1 NAD(P)/FAD-dependent oxidoreductase [Phycisphaerae bacterium]HOL27570.1 NAD(P)/FAD-dependent oxidoreductase [Phycisphaerae bacterium]HPP21812.1 NAD(P)/FAD-dependent oxidoreductase [Phycisphaerae bacterium]